MTVHDCAGWFGKIPSTGDFITRGLPRSFLGPWDQWLSSELSQAQRSLGDLWAESYRRAPPSCFALGEKVIDARVWSGVLVPSFDRVGREFPLTLAFGSAARVIAAGREWWTQLAAIGRAAAAPAGSAALLSQGLAGLIAFRGERETGNAASESIVSVPGEGLSRWWSEEEDRSGDPWMTEGLPMGAQFLDLLAPR